ncbi:hypothetical protein QCA50_006159 [Cerrena zonata]|uniref:U4/U6.U5 tri-snRNP-associated protein 1 n=1 Tax=Cerrena zonata TaxID=2478898 RepID=A0AAW0GCG4_9APHY
MEESISLEETNKIRISLGLKPLTEDATPTDDKEKQAEDNYSKARELDTKARESKQIQDRIAKVRNKRDLHSRLRGATLGDADGDADDTLKWIKRSKKKEKELAKKRQEELESMDKAFQEEYTERDIAGLKVSHDFEEMGEGEDRILTLKDSRILDNEEDELQNVEMAEHERNEKNKELKIKKRDYTGYDDDEFTPGQAGMKRAVLSKYDEFLEGPKETDFRLGSSSFVATKATDNVLSKGNIETVKTSLLSIDYDSEFSPHGSTPSFSSAVSENMETMDYLQPGDVGFKKPKTKKKRPSRRKVEISDDENEDLKRIKAMKPGDEIIYRSTPIYKYEPSDNFVDDDELQAALARSRRSKLKKLKKLTPEELAQRVAEETKADNDVNMVNDEDNADGGLTFDDTSEFVRAIHYDPTAVKVKKEQSTAEAPLSRAQSQQPSEPPDVEMKPEEDEAIVELEAGEVSVKEEEDEEAMLHDLENTIRQAEEAERAAAEAGPDVSVGTASEQTFGSGMAATLSILRNQGILAAPSADSKEREKVQLQRDLWLASYRRMLAERDLDRAKGRGTNKDQATREYENRLREQQEARQNLDSFKEYKPDVNIVYYDEFGRELTPKEAWKALSHKFHGKGSGRLKTEKRLKKIAEERKKEAMVSGDTPLSMNQAFQIRQEKAGQAHFVLSVGNRGAVPQAAEFSIPNLSRRGRPRRRIRRKMQQTRPRLLSSTQQGSSPSQLPLPTSLIPTLCRPPHRFQELLLLPSIQEEAVLQHLDQDSRGSRLRLWTRKVLERAHLLLDQVREENWSSDSGRERRERWLRGLLPQRDVET